jgi:hypothetical protein
MMETALIDHYQEEHDAQPFEKRYGSKLVDVNTLVSAVKKIRAAYDARNKELAADYEAKFKSLRRELLETKALTIETAAQAPTTTGGSVMALGLSHLEKRLDASTAEVKTLQEKHQNTQMQAAREIKSLKERNKELGGFFETWAQEVKGMYSRIETLEGFCAALPTMLKDLLGALPVPQVNVPNKALQVNVAPAEIAVQLPVRHTIKKFHYDEQSGKPLAVEETESDAPLRDMLTPQE